MDGKNEKSTARKGPDWRNIRQRLDSGEKTWRSLEELSGNEDLQAARQREFLRERPDAGPSINRRDFMKLAGASLALAGLTSCLPAPAERLVPYVQEPEHLTPGSPLFFATAHLLGGYATGVLVESHGGRPTRVEGNRQHPASLGASDIYAQASILTLYDPQRSREVLLGDIPASWAQFQADLFDVLQQGQGRLRLLTPTITSPTLISQMRQLLDAYPRARWHQYEPVNWDNAYEGARLAFDRPLQEIYHFDQADVIVSLDADFMTTHPGRLRYTRDFSARREPGEAQGSMNRLYAVSSSPTITASMADHHWPLRPSSIEHFARLLARELGASLEASRQLPQPVLAALGPLAADLEAHRGRSLVLAGLSQPPVVHALAHLMNRLLDNSGRTVTYTRPVQARVDNQVASLRELVGAMEAGEVDALLILGGNPAYTAPPDINFAGALLHVPFTAHLSLYRDETSAICEWHLPRAHPLESWSDARAYDGTATILQPLVQPLFGGRSEHELLARLLGAEPLDPYEIVRGAWQRQYEGDDFAAFWRQSLHAGVVPESAFQPLPAEIRMGDIIPPPATARDDETLLALFRPDPSVWDGHFANNAWLQELPRPFTKLTWDNAALVAPATAEEMDLSTGDVVRLRVALPDDETAEVMAPVFILPGQMPGCVTLHLGYGREGAADVGADRGFNAYAVRPSGSLWAAPILTLEKTNASYPLATTQEHHMMEGRDLVRVATLASFQDDAASVQGAGDEEQPSLYPQYPYEGYAWGMSINLNTCTGFQACVIACQAENNIPVVGKDGVLEGREMHWLRVDDYFSGDNLDAPQVYHQPVPCMHCEKAPCEPVCPVAATTHSAEGLNEMTYNRCVGTRYCGNNCPYKVRRFNFFDYQPQNDLHDMLYNPDVTVRSRGVMEKCTYCVQRINRVRSDARQEGRRIRDGDLKTACQEACPANAIVFGDINDPEAAVAQLKAGARDYGLLAELGTEPRTTYLVKLLNRNDEIDNSPSTGAPATGAQ